jgi:hypothetical protein
VTESTQRVESRTVHTVRARRLLHHVVQTLRRRLLQTTTPVVQQGYNSQIDDTDDYIRYIPYVTGTLLVGVQPPGLRLSVPNVSFQSCVCVPHLLFLFHFIPPPPTLYCCETETNIHTTYLKKTF